MAQRFEVTLTDTKPTHYYDITYELNGGDNNSGNPAQYEMSAGVASFYAATRTGYHFDGWFSDSGLTDAITSIPANSTGAKTLYAKWSPIEYAINYTLNKGTNHADNPNSYTIESDDITLKAPSRTGYTFAGWTGSNGSTPQTSVTIGHGSTGVLNYTANWTLIDYAINYTLNGGTVATANPTTYNVETKTFTLSTPTRTGYTFVGWTGSNGTTPQTTVTITKGSTTGAKTYTANWTPITYSVAFIGNGNTGGSMDAQSFTYDVAQALTANAFSCVFTVTYVYNEATGNDSEASATATATFNGWAESADGAKVYNDGQSVSNLSTESNATVNLFAKWTYGSVTLPAPTRTGYTFGGWYSDSGLNTLVGAAGASYTPSADITLYAKWTINQYTITFVTGDGGTVITPITQDYETDIIAPANPIRPGYNFTGWDKTIPTKMPAEDMTITALWETITYTITYDLGDGTLPTGQNNPLTYNVETETFTLINPSQSGFNFVGWTGSNGTEPETTVTINKGLTGDKTYTANWSMYTYVITFNLNGGSFLGDPNIPTGYDVSSEEIVINNFPLRDGYTFAGWTGTGIDSPESVITIPAGSMGNRSYIANWTPEKYSIDYNLNGGTNAPENPTQYNIESDIFVINPPTRDGYIFVGWTGWTYTTPQTTITIPTGTCGVLIFTAQWSKDYSSVWSQGTGTDENPYIISSATDLDQLALIVNAGEDFYGTCFKLGCDITFTGGSATESNYTTIGKAEGTSGDGWNINFFKGTFDGDGHTISGIRIYRNGTGDADHCQGLFGCVSGATIKNVTLTDAVITGYKYVGGIAGYYVSGTIENCYVTNSVTVNTKQGGAEYHGGIVGSCPFGGTTISHCTSAVQLSIDANVNASTCNYYGGIAGYVQGDIKNNFVVGATVPAVSRYYGAIGSTDAEVRYVNGELYVNVFGSMSNNYYSNCTVGGVADAINVGFGYMCGNYDGDFNLLESESGSRVTDWTPNDGAVSVIALFDDCDNSSAIALAAASNGTSNVKLAGRTLYKDGAWNSLCLPFAMTAEQVTTQLNPTALMTLSSSSFAGGTLTLDFEDATAIEAGRPYIIKWDDGTNLVSPTFKGVTVSTATAPVETPYVDFVGTFAPEVIYESGDAKQNLYLGDGSTLCWPTTEGFAVNSCRAYFRLKNGLTAGDTGSSVTAMRLNFGDPTGISPEASFQHSPEGKEAWFDLSGRRIDGVPIAPGIYIKNGKKVIVK